RTRDAVESLTRSSHPGTRYRCLRSPYGDKYLHFGFPFSTSGLSRLMRAVCRRLVSGSWYGNTMPDKSIVLETLKPYFWRASRSSTRPTHARASSSGPTPNLANISRSRGSSFITGATPGTGQRHVEQVGILVANH